MLLTTCYERNDSFGNLLLELVGFSFGFFLVGWQVGWHFGPLQKGDGALDKRAARVSIVASDLGASPGVSENYGWRGWLRRSSIALMAAIVRRLTAKAAL